MAGVLINGLFLLSLISLSHRNDFMLCIACAKCDVFKRCLPMAALYQYGIKSFIISSSFVLVLCTLIKYLEILTICIRFRLLPSGQGASLSSVTSSRGNEICTTSDFECKYIS